MRLRKVSMLPRSIFQKDWNLIKWLFRLPMPGTTTPKLTEAYYTLHVRGRCIIWYLPIQIKKQVLYDFKSNEIVRLLFFVLILLYDYGSQHRNCKDKHNYNK